MPDRRQVLSMLLAAAAMPAGSLAARTPAESAGMPPDQVFLNRLTFGATAADRTRLAKLGRTAWLDEQLALPARDAAMSTRLANLRLRISYDAGDEGMMGGWPATDELRPLTALDADPATLLPLIEWDRPVAWPERVRPADEVIAASLVRAVHARAQVREVMTQFWHDHFNVHAFKSEAIAVTFPLWDATLRDHALGNVRTLLGHVARSPAMLYYLDNHESRASPANENFARELLELHTLGAENYLSATARDWTEVPRLPDGTAAGYIDADVYEVARAFTGWTVGDGRWLADGVTAPRTLAFHHVDAWHDPYQKRILAHDFRDHAAPQADGDAVLDLLARHPGTARHLCRKIAQRLLADDPPTDLVDRLTDRYLATTDAPDQIAGLVRLIATDPAFDAPPTKMRRPFEFLAALYRATGATIAAEENGWHWQLSRAGWLQHAFPPPTGHPDRLEDWATGGTIRRLTDYAISAHEDWFATTPDRLSALLPPQARTIGDAAAHWTTALHGTPADRLPELLAAAELDPAAPLPTDPQERHDLSSAMVAFAALSPQFMFR
jgi:uncharacterized protein (DUF1800 family)